MKIEDLKKLQQKKYRESLGHFLVEGEHLVLELQKAAANNVALQACELYVTDNYQDWRSPFNKHVIDDRQMAQIAETKTPQGIVALVPLLPPTLAIAGERSIYLHEIQDPGNLGTILRTLAWFGGFRCLLSPNSVDPYNGKAVRASMGAIFHVPIEINIPLSSVAARYQQIACLELAGEDLASPAFKNFDCYLFGSEARGLPHDQLAAMQATPYTIRGRDSIDSLNVAAAAHMCAYEINRSTVPNVIT